MASVRPAWSRRSNATGGWRMFCCPWCHQELDIKAWGPGQVMVGRGWHPSGGPQRRGTNALGPGEVLVYSKPRRKTPGVQGGLLDTPLLVRCPNRGCGELCRLDNPPSMDDSSP